MAQQFVVIGLGIFGRNVCLNLARAGQTVLAIDLNQDEVRLLAGELDAVICADATDETTLREIGIDRMSCAVVAIGAESMEASILVTALLRQLGVPRIVARALSELHARVLHAVGAHEVVSPEAEMGLRLARRLAQPNVIERFDLGHNAELAELAAPQSFVGSTLVDLDVRRRFGVTVVAIRRAGAIRATLEGSERIEPDDVLITIGTPDAVRRLAGRA